MPSSNDEREYVDVDHPYMTDHKLDEFTWSFDTDDAAQFAAELVSHVIRHTVDCGPEHALADFGLQGGYVLSDVLEGTMLPVLMMSGEDGKDFPVAVLLNEQGPDAPLPLAHTIGMLVTEEGIFPALPSRMRESFENPPTQEDTSDEEDV